METKKIAVSCFIGAVLCAAIALLFSPAFWWLGMIAGFAGGYMSYEFREVLKVIPVALHNASENLGDIWHDLGIIGRELVGYIRQPHPFAYLAGALNFLVLMWIYGFTTIGRHSLSRGFVNLGDFFTFMVFGGLLFWLASAVLVALFVNFAQPGARHEKCVWTNDPAKVKPEEEHHYRIVLLTYTDGYRWLAKGIGLLVLCFVWFIPKYLVIGVWNVFSFLGRFAWYLFKLIHSEKRLLCAVDGTLGGTMSYFWLSPSASSTGSQITLVLFGGLIGSALGILNWEIVSKRILCVGKQEA